MGAPNYELAPAAILLDNPIISIEDFAERLNEVRCSAWWHCKPKAPYRSWGRRQNGMSKEYTGEYNTFHRGRYGIAESILHLPESEEFLKRYPVMYDCEGLKVMPPDFYLQEKAGEDKWVEPSFQIRFHVGNKILEEKIMEYYSRKKLSAGDISGCDMTGELYVVDEIIEEGKLTEEILESGNYGWAYKMKVRTFDEIFREEKYKNEADLTEARPEFAFENRYDLKAMGGVLYPSNPNHLPGSQEFFWKQQDGRYSLDEITFDRIKAEGRKGFTDLIITAEIVKNKAWKFLCYNGGRYVQQFLAKYPESEDRHQKAVFDSWLSEYAKINGLTHTDLIRLSLDAKAKYRPSRANLSKLKIAEEEEERAEHFPSSTSVSEKDDVPF